MADSFSILLMDKKCGVTSFESLYPVKRENRGKKVGHAGTLDKFASGLMVVLVGGATKLTPLFSSFDKEYIASIHFGAETDTLDPEGSVIATAPLPSEESLKSVLPGFLGRQMQTPPVYSAIKINGDRAYDLARKGVEVVMPPREVEIFSLEILEDFPFQKQTKFKVRCSKGTYVRTLGRDIALKLGTLGFLKDLRRTKCGNFDLSHKILLENLENIVYGEDLNKFLLPLETFLCDITVIAVSEVDAAKLKLGQGLSPKNYDVSQYVGSCAVATCFNKLVAIVRIEESKIAPVRVFNL